MGTNSENFHNGYKRVNGTGLHVLYPPKHNDLKPPKSSVKKVETAKLLMGIFSALGIPAYILGIVWNFGDIKGWCLFVVGFAYAIARVYFYIIRQKQEKKIRDLDYRRQLMEIEREIFPHQ